LKSLTGKLSETTVIDPSDENGVVTMHIHNEFLNHNQKLQLRNYEQVLKELEILRI